ncbi:MAG: sensor domain-containing diguanylate cyclase [Dehalococcoidia bacterium]
MISWTHIHEVLGALSDNASDDGELAGQASELIASYLGTDVVVRRLDAGDLKYLGGGGRAEQAAARPLTTPPPALVDRLLAGQGAQPLELESSDRDYLGPLPGASSVLPLLSAGELQGTVLLGSPPEAGYSDEQLALAGTVAAFLGPAIALNRRLRTMEKRQRRNEELIRLIAAASEAPNLRATLHEICSLVADSSVAERCSVLLYREGDRRLAPVMSRGTNTNGPDRTTEDSRIWVDAVVARRPIIASDASELARKDSAWQLWVERFGVKSIATFPIHTGDRFTGVIVVDSSTVPCSFPIEEVAFLREVAGQVGVLIEQADLQERLRQQATTDPLTQLYNRRYIEERMSEEINRSRRSSEPLVVLILDVDHLKQVNDSYGHLAGDAVLLRLAQALRASCRVSDVVGRIAGDEFMVLLPGTRRETARVVIERLLTSLRNEPAEVDGERIVPKVSIGLAEFPGDGQDSRSLFAFADADLYRQKSAGRTTAP